MNCNKESESVVESLKSLCLLQIELGGATVHDMSIRFSKKEKEVEKELEELVLCGFAHKLEIRQSEAKSVVNISPKYVMTEVGRKRLKIVVTTGVFDLLHVGHLMTLEASQEFGDLLLVIIARDVTVEKRKGRLPINSEQARLKLVEALKPVDAAYLGHTSDYLRIIHRIHPDLIVLGKDQEFGVEDLKLKLREKGLQDIEVIKLNQELEGVHSSILLEKIRDG